MPSLGLGRKKPPLFAFQPWPNLFSLNDDARVLAEELYFGGYPPVPVQIPVGWLSPPMRIRQDSPLNVAEVSPTSGTVARSRNQQVIDSHGRREWKFTAVLDTVVPADPQNLATWVTDTYDITRPRISQLTLVLTRRTEAELHRLMRVVQGVRISITDPPGTWPTGAGELIVEGIRHVITADLRVLVWNTSPVLGEVAGQVGPWFTADDSRTDGTDLVPF
jgi:hypothetical protein